MFRIGSDRNNFKTVYSPCIDVWLRMLGPGMAIKENSNS
jgi:hypothetical protein